MRYIIAVGSIEYSEPTLRAGMQIAKKTGAEVTIVYVGEQIRSLSSHSVQLAQENLEKWDLERPGVEVLEWAYNFLADNNYITPTSIETGFRKNRLISTGGSRYKLILAGTVCSEVKLILRHGEIISELRKEVRRNDADVTIIGGSQQRRMAYELIQFIDSTIFVVNQFDIQKDYRILLPVNDSRRTKRAVKYSVRVADALEIPIDILCVSKKEAFGEGYKTAVRWAESFLNRTGHKGSVYFKVGQADRVIKEMAGDDHIIIMGMSEKNPIVAFFKGNKPARVLEGCTCPILIVK